MAELTVDALGELTSPAANDEIGIWDVSAGQYLKIRRDTLVGGTVTGGGTIATGGYTLTVPQTMTAAGRDVAQTFSAAQTFTAAVSVAVASPTTNISLPDRAGASGQPGPHIFIGRNTTVESPGFVRFTSMGGAAPSLYFDDSSVLRMIANDPVTSANESTGTIIGTQTSSLDAKNVIGGPLAIDDVLAAVVAGAEAVRRFTYKSGAYGGEEFSGVVVDYAPRYGMDRDADHPSGKSLNVVTVVGDLLLAVAHLARRVAALEERG